jgi:hypothetical protein
MKTWVRKTLSVGVLAAGALLFAPGGAAHADARQSNGDNNGILNGTQLVTGVQVPVNIVGNSLGILGEANSFGAGVNRVEGTRVGQSNGDNNGIANGTQAYLPISVPLNIVGNSAAVAGEANSAGVGANSVHSGRHTESAHTTEGGWWGGNQSNGDNNGILNGTQVYAPISVPINACGNSLAVLGGAYSQAICGNDVFGGSNGHRHARRESAKVTESGWQSNGDNNGIANGTQLYAPISLPINLAGNSAAILGEANSRALAGNRIESAQGGPRQDNGDNNGILNGTQIAAPISIPINVCGNSLGLLGSASSAAACGNDVFGGDDFFGDHGKGHGWGGDLGGDNGHKGHGHKGGQNAGDNGNQDPGYKGDNGSKPTGNSNGGYGGTAPATNDGYGATAPATNDAGYTKGDDKGTKDDSDGYKGRGKSATEATPVSSLTDTVGGMGDSSGLGGLGLLNTLR